MNFHEYQQHALETAIYEGRGTITGLMYAGLGLGEAGEVQGKIKKVWRDSNGQMTREMRAKILEEIGDLLWYCAVTCSELGADINDVAVGNLAKLKSRQERGVLGGSGDNR